MCISCAPDVGWPAVLQQRRWSRRIRTRSCGAGDRGAHAAAAPAGARSIGSGCRRRASNASLAWLWGARSQSSPRRPRPYAPAGAGPQRGRFCVCAGSLWCNLLRGGGLWPCRVAQHAQRAQRQLGHTPAEWRRRFSAPASSPVCALASAQRMQLACLLVHADIRAAPHTHPVACSVGRGIQLGARATPSLSVMMRLRSRQVIWPPCSSRRSCHAAPSRRCSSLRMHAAAAQTAGYRACSRDVAAARRCVTGVPQRALDAPCHAVAVARMHAHVHRTSVAVRQGPGC